MSEEPNILRGDIAKRLANKLGLAKMSPEEAQRILDAAPGDLPPLKEDYIDDIIRLTTRREVASCEDASEGLWQTAGPADVEEENVVLNRNPGSAKGEASALLEQFRNEALEISSAPKTKLDEQSERNLIEQAAEQAEELVTALGIREAPVDPFAIAATEKSQVIVKEGDFGELFDGQLEFHRRHEKFLLFINSKYDTPGDERHHPRTRFSMAHELAHYFLEDHHRYLRTGGKVHRSRGEFFSEQQREREADAFAAAMLMPRRLFEEDVNQGELCAQQIFELAGKFQTSVMSTALRAVQLSHFPCALAAIRGGALAWTRCSESLINAGCYPGGRGWICSADVVSVWKGFEEGREIVSSAEGMVRDWFQTYTRPHLERLPIAQHFIGIPSMGTLLVLLSIAEGDLYGDDED